jgi:hypothetical protein
MRKDLSPDDLDGLLKRPLVAVLATYRATAAYSSRRSGTAGETAASTS